MTPACAQAKHVSYLHQGHKGSSMFTMHQVAPADCVITVQAPPAATEAQHWLITMTLLQVAL
jgi:hypothetical protein